MIPSWSPLTRTVSSAFHCIAFTDALCACMMFSKWNWNPFQIVISPDCVPLIRRRPLGNQCTTFTGERFLVVEAWTKRGQMAS